MKSMFEGIAPFGEAPTDPAQDWQNKLQQTREIVAKRNRGEELSREEKLIVMEVVNEAVKGMSVAREKELEARVQKVDQSASPPQEQLPQERDIPVDPNIDLN